MDESYKILRSIEETEYRVAWLQDRTLDLPGLRWLIQTGLLVTILVRVW